MKICIIGHGYIGSKLVQYFSSSCPEAELVCITRTKVDTSRLSSQCQCQFVTASYENLPTSFFHLFDVIILTAGQSSPKSSENTIVTLNNDVINYTYLLEALQPTQKLIYISSAAVYGAQAELIGENSNVYISDNYTLAKSTMDNITMLNLTKQVYGLRIGTLNGSAPVKRIDLMINKMVHDAQAYGKIEVSDCKRAILGTIDLCRVIEKIIHMGTQANAGVYNIASLNSSATKIAKYVADKLKVDIVEKQQAKKYHFQLDTTRFCKTFNFKFQDTIETIVEDLCSHTTDLEKVINNYQPPYEMEWHCRVCKTSTKQLLDLGRQPLANNYHGLFDIPQEYPLQLHYCPNCFHVQLNCTVRPDILFKDYIYVSGTSATGREYFYNFAKDKLRRYQQLHSNTTTLKVLDIACNDGSQLDAFQRAAEELGVLVQTIGVDPAENLYSISSSKGHHVICDFFNADVASKLEETFGSINIIVAQNVFAHISYPSEFLEYCQQLTNENSIIYIQTSQANMILNGEFDTAYHEHLSFFNTNSMRHLCSAKGLVLNRVDLTPIHGTSYLFEITGCKLSDSNLVDTLYNELSNGLYSEETYTNYTYKCMLYKNNFHNMLLDYKLQGYSIIGYGSTAKSNTLLNFCGVSNDIVDYIIDENNLKQGTYTPGSNIHVCGPDSLSCLQVGGKYLIVVFAWNFYKEISEKIQKLVNTDVHIANINPIVIQQLQANTFSNPDNTLE